MSFFKLSETKRYIIEDYSSNLFHNTIAPSFFDAMKNNNLTLSSKAPKINLTDGYEAIFFIEPKGEVVFTVFADIGNVITIQIRGIDKDTGVSKEALAKIFHDFINNLYERGDYSLRLT